LASETGCATVACDVTSEADVAALVRKANDLFGGTLDAVVNIAGGAFGVDPVATADLDQWRRMYELNVLGTTRVTQALLPLLRANGRGSIVLLTSTAAQAAYTGGGGYNVAKAGEHMVAGALRLELVGEPIRVIEIAPGMVHTEEFSRVRLGDQAAADAVYEGVAHPLTAEDVADVVAYSLNLPAHVNLDLVTIRPVAQASNYHVARNKGV
jgi:NADP-dependent 3-hydroxy acid dehydrogenase YdfG